MRSVRIGAVLGGFALLGLAAPTLATAARPSATHVSRLASGVAYAQFRQHTPVENVHVVTIKPNAPVRAYASLSNNQVAEQPVSARLETTSHACARTGCVAGVNADYFCTARYCPRDIYSPEGGVVTNGRMLRSPYSTGWAEQQLMLDPQGCPLPPGKLKWQGVVTDGTDTLSLSGVNVDRNNDQVILYDTAFGPHTPPATRGGELVVKLDNPHWLGDFNKEVTGRAVRYRRSGETRLARGTVVLSASANKADTLHQMAVSHQRLSMLLVPSEPVWNSVGAKPLLLANGKYTGIWPHQPLNPFTIFAWKADCTRFLITVDGRQPGSKGINIQQAAALAIRLGATTAYGFDSGGSTTLVGPGGRILNHPSDETSTGKRVERRVADSLLFLPDHHR